MFGKNNYYNFTLRARAFCRIQRRFWPKVRSVSSFLLFVAVFLGCTSTGRVGLMLLVAQCPGTIEGSTGSGSGSKASQKTGQRPKVSSDRLGEAGNRTCDPWFIRHRFIPGL